MLRTGSLLMLLSWGSVVAGQEVIEDPPQTEAAELTETFRKQAHAMMQQYEFTLPERPDVNVEFVPEPLLYWTNPESGNWEGVIYLWIANGRPAVIASPLHHADRRKMAHEFHQLIDTPLVGKRNSQLVWKTEESGVNWRPLPDAPPPAKSPSARAFQMRALSRKVSAVKYGPGEAQIEMRLLSRYLYRNQVSEDSDVLDGACFVLMQSTNPQIVVLFEARKSAEDAQWYYALARLNQYEYTVSYDGEVVQQFPFVPFAARSDPSAPYTKFFNQLYQDLP